MEPDLILTLKGLSDEEDSKIRDAVAATIREIYQVDNNLDLRRMHRIIVTTDFAGELQELAKETVSGNPITHTNEEYAIAVAKIILLPKDDDYEIVPVVNAVIGAALAEYESEDYEESFRYIFHLLHHELCHVHDDNKKLDALHELMLTHCYEGKDIFIGPLTEICWSEYFANRMCSSTATDDAIQGTIANLDGAITRTKETINAEIRSYRRHADLGHFMDLFKRHGEFLVKSAAYVLGYVDGLEKPLSSLSGETANNLAGSYFEETWSAMHEALNKMYAKYPEEWEDLGIYDELATVLEEYYNKMGLVLSTVDGYAYVNIPFRPGTI